MRWFWLTVLVCFVWVSTHEAVAHAHVCGNPAESASSRHDRHADGTSTPDDPADADDDHHGHDSHEHFQGAVSAAPVKPIIKTLLVPGLPVTFESIGAHASGHSFLRLRQAFRLPANEPPRYLSAQTLLL
jgi:hypothetical protein